MFQPNWLANFSEKVIDIDISMKKSPTVVFKVQLKTMYKVLNLRRQIIEWRYYGYVILLKPEWDNIILWLKAFGMEQESNWLMTDLCKI